MRLRAPIPPEGQVRSRTGVRSYRAALLVEVDTDEGFTGIGSCSGNGAIIEVIIEKVLKPLLIGMDPTKTEELWEKSYFSAGVREFGSRGIGVVALSGVDTALWDILGKVKNVPVFRLLGGSCRERVQVYATALYPEEPTGVVKKALSFAENGFSGVKIKVGFDLAKDLEIVKAVRAALGRDFTLMTDANMGYEIEVALKAAAVLEECRVAWLEEPLFVEDIEGHAHLKARSKVPIALGENLHTRFAFEQFMARNAVDILQPDVARAGGISEIKHIASLATRHGLPISFHTYGDAVALAASLHLAAALENSHVMELDCTCNPLRTELLKEPLEAKDGFMIPPQGPGLGIDLNPQALRRYLFAGADEVSLWQRALRAV
ncbi:MAG: mandelate racemase/muconate lactonizing enzyme family protein [Candidatus Binatia bacterium]